MYVGTFLFDIKCNCMLKWQIKLYYNISVGAVMAGFPISYLASHILWRGAFIIIEVLLALIFVLNLITRSLEYKILTTRKKLD